MPRKAANVPANENNTQRFVRLANQKVNSVLTQLKSIGGLGNTKLYTSTPEQRKKIQEVLTGAVSRTMDSMNRGGEATQDFKV
jgi:hypothetical protein